MLCWQIHECLRRFEKRGLLPAREHAAGLAQDVSDPGRGGGGSGAPLRPLPLIRRGLPRARATRILSDSQKPPKLRCLTAVRSWRTARVDRTAAKIIVRAPARVSAFVYFQRRSSAPVAPRRSCPCASSWLYLCLFCVVSCFPAVSPPCFHTLYLPPIFYILSHALLSFPSLPSPQIRFDSLSPPGLNHQGPLVGPNQGPVSPQRGFCLLTVETNEPPPRRFDILKQSLPRFARRDECRRCSAPQPLSSLKHPTPHCSRQLNKENTG